MRTKAPKKTLAGNGAAVSAAAAPIPVNGNAAVTDAELKGKEPKPPFWEFLHTLGDHWEAEGVVVYVYRVWPVIDKREEEHYLCKLSEPSDEDALLRAFGSGKYLLRVNNGRGKTLHKHVVSLHNPSFPPKVDRSEVIASDPRNETYFEVWGRPKETTAATAPVATGSDTNAVLGTVLEKANKVDPVLVDLFKETTKQRDELAQKLSQQQSPTVPAQPDYLAMFKVWKESQPAQIDQLAMFERIKSLLVKEQKMEEPKADPFANIAEIVDLFGKLKTTFTPESPAPTVTTANPDAELWEKIALTISGQVSGIVNALPGIIAAWKMNGAVAPIPGIAPTAPQAPSAFDPYRDSAARNAFARAQNAPQPGPQTPPQATAPGQPSPVPPGTTPNPAESAPGAGTVQPAVLIAKGLDCLNRGFDGREFAHSVIVSDGDLAYNQIAAQIKSMGIPVVIQLAKQLPELGAQVSAYEGPLTRFIEDFVAGPEYDEQDAAEETAASA